METASRHEEATDAAAGGGGGVADTIKEKNIKEKSKRRSSDNDGSTSVGSSIAKAPMPPPPPSGLAESTTSQQQNIIDDTGGPILLPDGRTVEFSVHAIQSQIVCPLCCGTLKEPYRLTKCLHTFCKSCLWFAVNRCETYSCPTCQEYFGGKDKWTKFALPDRTLQDILDKVLFPDVAAQDEEQEQVFYARCHIERKVEFQKRMIPTTTSTNEELNSHEQRRRKKSKSHGNDRYNDYYPQQQQPGDLTTATAETTTASLHQASSQPPPAHRRPKQKKKNEPDDTCIVGFRLVPWDEQTIPSLQRSYLETSAKITVAQLKKYLQMKLNNARDDDDADAAITTTTEQEQQELEILCNDVVLGTEVSVYFVLQSLWVPNDAQQPQLTLKYRYATVAGP